MYVSAFACTMETRVRSSEMVAFSWDTLRSLTPEATT